MIIFVHLPMKNLTLKSEMKRFLLSIGVFLLFAFVMKAQMTAVSESLTQVYNTPYARFYSFNYPSKDAAGNDVVLSSMLIAWNPATPSATDSIESLHIYSHYTITSDKECPTSNSNLQDRLLFAMLVKASYASDPTTDFISRCIVIAPDYQGYGVTRSMSHPYLAQELTARQVVDAVMYGMRLYQKLVDGGQALPVKTDWRTFAYGYSQGGAVTLAVQRYLEETTLDEDLHFRGSICGDGPYDLMETLRYYLQDDGDSFDTTTRHRKGLCTMPMVIPMIIKGMLDTHPDMAEHTLGDYLSQQFLDTGIMDWLASKDFSTGEISKKWYQQLQNGLDANGRHYSPEQMAELFYSPSTNDVWGRLDKVFTPGLYEYLSNEDNFSTVPSEKGDVWQDIHRALADNNVASGWEPRHRIQFVHSRGDMVVPYANYLAFSDAHPFYLDNLYRIDDSLTPSDHTDVGTSFFLKLFAGAYGDYFKWVDEPVQTTGLRPTPNPSRNGGEVYDLSGRKANSKFKIQDSKLRKGIYIQNGRKVVF